uniref:Uncharacterized protein n=1 Tax=Oryza nivara TaxID=4536 RepID=A0A0E0HTP9_ORYNI
MSMPRFLLLVVLLAAPLLATAQQQYEANAQGDCYTDNGRSVLGRSAAMHGHGLPHLPLRP